MERAGNDKRKRTNIKKIGISGSKPGGGTDIERILKIPPACKLLERHAHQESDRIWSLLKAVAPLIINMADNLCFHFSKEKEG